MKQSGTWYYRVRGFDYNLPTGVQQMGWSDIQAARRDEADLQARTGHEEEVQDRPPVEGR